MSALADRANALEIQGICPSGLGQSCPKHYPHPAAAQEAGSDGILGPPLSIREVARMLGVSPWTIRQQHLPRGLPHFRSGPNGKLVFFRDQVVAWIITQQKKGGKP
jgi:hypothetical protein